MAAIVSLNQYFYKQRPLAMGIGSGGVGVGIFAFGLLQKYFVQLYAWKVRCTVYMLLSITRFFVCLRILGLTPPPPRPHLLKEATFHLCTIFPSFFIVIALSGSTMQLNFSHLKSELSLLGVITSP